MDGKLAVIAKTVVTFDGKEFENKAILLLDSNTQDISKAAFERIQQTYQENGADLSAIDDTTMRFTAIDMEVKLKSVDEIPLKDAEVLLKMKVYRKCPRTGFMETMNTQGNYKPVGWSTTREAAAKKK